MYSTINEITPVLFFLTSYVNITCFGNGFLSVLKKVIIVFFKCGQIHFTCKCDAHCFAEFLDLPFWVSSTVNGCDPCRACQHGLWNVQYLGKIQDHLENFRKLRELQQNNGTMFLKMNTFWSRELQGFIKSFKQEYSFHLPSVQFSSVQSLSRVRLFATP